MDRGCLFPLPSPLTPASQPPDFRFPPPLLTLPSPNILCTPTSFGVETCIVSLSSFIVIVRPCSLHSSGIILKFNVLKSFPSDSLDLIYLSCCSIKSCTIKEKVESFSVQYTHKYVMSSLQ